MRELNVHPAPLRHQVGLDRGAELGELLANLVGRAREDAKLLALAVVHRLNLVLPVGGREYHCSARKALLQLLQAAAVREHDERPHAESLERAVRDARLRDRHAAAVGKRGAPGRLRCEEGLGERGARAPRRCGRAEAVRQSKLLAGVALAGHVVVAVPAAVRHALHLEDAVLLNHGDAVGLGVQ